MEYNYFWEKGLSADNPARNIRKLVFEDEQGFIDEFDEIDEMAYHLVLMAEDRPVACGRIFPADEPDTFKLGRLAVLKEYRGLGLGVKTVLALEEKAKSLGAKGIMLSAQERARGFYESLGYKAEGDIYYEEYCPHIKMTKTL
ncbi:MAG TPA: GNAT family N-acetyltransferase [Clostridiales bacterium]|nr:GNAT family N-acetyltransferase [Clostridiales bacterium]